MPVDAPVNVTEPFWAALSVNVAVAALWKSIVTAFKPVLAVVCPVPPLTIGNVPVMSAVENMWSRAKNHWRNGTEYLH